MLKKLVTDRKQHLKCLILIQIRKRVIALFLDTNILLHFQTFDEIDWKKLAGGNCVLQIAPIVIDELDKHKNNSNSKIAQRARMIANKLEQIMDGEPGKAAVDFVLKRPDAMIFDRNQLDPKQQDDSLLSSIIEYKELHPNCVIKLVSDDTGVKLKAKSLGIEICKPVPELRLPENLDKTQKELKNLQKKLDEATQRIPKVCLAFEKKQTFCKLLVRSNVKSFKQFQQEEDIKIRVEHSLMQLVNLNEPSTNIFDQLNRNGGIFGLSNKNRENYNNKLEEYYKIYDEFLVKRYDHAMKRLRSFQLNFLLFNDGSTPGDDIDVWLHLPDGFKVVKSYSRAPEPPKPPYRPKNDYDMEPMSASFLGLNFVDRVNPGFQTSNIDPDKPTIRQTNSYEVTYHCATLKHGLSRELNPIILQYDSFEDMKNFQIDYRLNISNVPKRIEGQLNVIIEHSKSSTSI